VFNQNIRALVARVPMASCRFNHWMISQMKKNINNISLIKADERAFFDCGF